MAQSTSNPKIVIIGAGIAGIGAAETLSQAGFENITLLEATSRIGGRIATIYDNDGLPYKLELGANWIHGTVENPVCSIAEDNQLFEKLTSEATCCSDAYSCLSESGEVVSADTVFKVRMRLTALANRCNSLEDDVSLGDFVMAEFKSYIERFSKPQQRLVEAILENRILSNNADDACDHLSELSAKYQSAYEELKGPNLVIPQGFDKVIECMARNLSADVIQLNSPVQTVDWSELHCSSKGADIAARKPLRIQTNNKMKEMIDADCVIVTCSLGYLKDHAQDMFSPSLPTAKMHAIENLGIGVVDKVFLEFDNLDFLPEDATYLLLFWDVSKSTYQDKRRTGKDWTRRLFEFYIEDTPKQNTLITWVVGKEAVHMETLSDKQVAEGCVKVLRKFLKNKKIPLPKKVIRTNWHSMPYIKGSYSYTTLGTSPKDREILSEPICHPGSSKPMIMFAGEATHPSFYSTVHGALISGQREARRIIEAYKKQQTPSF